MEMIEPGKEKERKREIETILMKIRSIEKERKL